jgi:hypothetical protein
MWTLRCNYIFSKLSHITGYHNWKDLSRGLKNHSLAKSHIEATSILNDQGKQSHVLEAITKADAEEKKNRRGHV